jgi:uncharacterized protein
MNAREQSLVNSRKRRMPFWLFAAAILIACVGCKKDPHEVFVAGMDAYAREDYATALKLWRPLAESGDPSSQTNLGVMYSQGKGVAADPAEAIKWYKLAAAQNYEDAQYNLALLYRDGKGTAANMEEAIKWFKLAAQRGHLKAKTKLGDIYARGTGVERDTREAIKWYEPAAEKGDPEAQLALGDIYAKGDGVPTDRTSAYVWYSAAVAQDFDELSKARAAMGRMRVMSNMDEVEIAEGERQAEEWRDVKRTEANQ